MTVENGGFAFPLGLAEDYARELKAQTGMTLRDWLAAMALQGLISNQDVMNKNSGDAVVRIAFRYADAMLEARKK